MCQKETNQTTENKENRQECQYSICMEIAGAESIEDLNVEAPKAKDYK